jgi:hypothetical protein
LDSKKNIGKLFLIRIPDCKWTRIIEFTKQRRTELEAAGNSKTLYKRTRTLHKMARISIEE